MSQANNKIVAKNTLILYLRMFLVMCVQLYTSRVILDSLGVVDFGIYGVVGGIVVMFSSIMGSLSGSVSRFLTVELGKGDLEELRKTFSSSLLMLVLQGLLIVILSETIGIWFLNNKMEIPIDRLQSAFWVLQFSILTSFLSVTQVPYTSIIVAHENMKIYAYLGLSESFAKLGVAFLISISPIDKLIWYAMLIMVIQLSSILILRLYCLRNYEESRFRFHRNFKQYKEILVYSLYDLIGNLSVMLQGQGLNMLLNTFFGPVVNAARAIAYQVQGATNQFTGNFITALRPRIMKLYAQGKENEMMSLVYFGSITTYILVLLLIVPLSFEINFILSLWLGEYPNYADSFTIIVLIAALLNSARNPRIIVFHATGKIRLSNIVTGSVLCSAFPIGYVLLKMGGSPNAAFYGMLFSVLLADITNMFILRRCVNFSILDFCKKVHLKNLSVTFFTLFIVYLVHNSMNEGFMRLLAVGLTSTISILGFSWIIVPNAEQRNKAITFIKGKLHHAK